MAITQQQYATSLQNIQGRYISLELLNYNYQTVDELRGIAIGGSITIDANSDIRRTANLTLAIKDYSFVVSQGGRIWLDKYIRVYVGTRSLITGEIEYTNCGMYIIDAPSYSYDAATNTLSLMLLDIMAKLTGLRNGYLRGIPTVFKAGENIRSAIISTLELGGITKYVVTEAPSPGVIPVDLEFGQGSTIYDLLSGLRDIYPNYEMYFDVDGVFYYKPIPTGAGDPIIASDELWDKIVINEGLDVDFQGMKNSIEVFGRTHSPEHYSTLTTVSNNYIDLIMADVTEYTTDMIYGFNFAPGVAAINNTQLRINSLSYYPLRHADGAIVNIPATTIDTYYCIQFKGTYWLWLGHLQAYGFAEDTNDKSPFWVEGNVGRIRTVLTGGTYDNCMTDDLAQERAEYELWLATNMKNSITLNCVPVSWLDVNNLVEYTAYNTGVINKYLIKTINMGLGVSEPMTVNMIQFYPNATKI